MTEIELKEIDCVEGMQALPSESVDVVVTSPPYNLGIKYRKYNDKQREEKYIEWTIQWLNEVKRVLKNDGSLFLNLGSCPRKPLLPFRITLTASSIFVLQNTFHWIKSISVNTKDGNILSVGHFKPLTSKRYVNDCHEFVLHLTKTGRVPINRLAVGVPYADKSNVKRWGHTGGRDVRCRGNNWYIPYKTITSRNKQRPHPATFPPKLAEYAISIHGPEFSEITLKNNYVVLDPFVGIGNAALGARAIGVRKFIGFDIDGSYLADARRLLT